MKLKKPDTTISIASETIIRTIAYTVIAVLLLGFISEIGHELRLIAVSIFLAIALNPAVGWFSRRLKLKSRIRAAAVAYVIVIGTLISMLSLILPPLVQQSTDFIQNIPETISDFRTQDTAVAEFVRENNLDDQLQEFGDDLSSRLADTDGPVLSTASRVGGTIVSFITVLVLTFMILVEGPSIVNKALSFSDPTKRAPRRKLIKKMYRVVTAYVNGQVLIAAIAAGFALIALLIATAVTDSSVNAIALTGIVFIFGLVPLIGNVLAAVVVVLFALFASTTLAVIMAIYFVIYQQIENATLQPYIQSRSNQLTPLTVFAAAIVGAGYGGLLGALAAIPLAGIAKVLIDEKIPTKS